GFESSFKLCDFCFKMFSGDAHARHHRCEPSSHLPVTLEGAGIAGESPCLQVRVSSYNFTANHQTFTISRILNEPDRRPLHDFVTQDNYDDNNADMPGSVSVPTKVDIDDTDYEEVPTAGTTSTGVNNNKSLTAGTSKVRFPRRTVSLNAYASIFSISIMLRHQYWFFKT
ncbi:unnamed protein product, partial [Brassica oleracea]